MFFVLVIREKIKKITMAFTLIVKSEKNAMLQIFYLFQIIFSIILSISDKKQFSYTFFFILIFKYWMRKINLFSSWMITCCLHASKSCRHNVFYGNSVLNAASHLLLIHLLMLKICLFMIGFYTHNDLLNGKRKFLGNDSTLWLIFKDIIE